MASTDRAALVALYNATDGANWTNNTNWNTAAPLGQWQGVTANDQGRVVELKLDVNNLKGHIPPQLGDLGALQVLSLSENKLEGPIPRELGKLTALQELSLGSNKLSGHIPPQLGDLSALKRLDLSWNKIDGNIPAALGQLSNLEELDLSVNDLSGSIPKELGAVSALEVLRLDENRLSGHIPPQLGDLGALQVLSLSANKLEGHIPPQLGDLGALQLLSLYGNKLEGEIPTSLGQLTNLVALHLHVNRLSGHIPPELGNLSELQKLWLYDNELTGTIPKELGALSALRELRLYRNQLSGSVPPELGKLAALQILHLRSNQLTEIPPKVLELCRARLQEPSWDGNPWSRPPSTVLESGFESALGWWEDVKRFGQGKSNKLKLVLVGVAEAGKTTIVRHFTGGPVPTRPDRTVGIEITRDWRPMDEGRLQVSVWDFAGQEDYYSSHQLFLTKGALFLLVVDLRIFYDEVQRSGVENFNDRHRRIYWWLEMLHMRVPGAALALVGSHVDRMKEKDADEAGAFLHTVVSKFIEEKAKNASMRQSSRRINAAGPTVADTDHPRDAVSSVQPLGSREISTTPLVLHGHVFKVSLDRTSVTELRQWIVKAASARECPPGFNFPAVDQVVPKAWMEAYDAMDVLRGTTPCVLWNEAVRAFMERIGGSIPDGGEVLLRAMQHREAEGGVLLSLANPSDPVGTDMLHLDPAWLIELVRRLTDHNLVDKDKEKQDNIKGQLREYAKENGDDFARLWDTHRAYLKSGYLDKGYLRFLWIHRKIQGTPSSAVVLSASEFGSIVSTMARLLVMYGSRETDKLVVPARLPEYGPESVMSPDNIAEIVVTMKCSFGQVYPPPGIVGRFLAWLTKHVHRHEECWQHGAFLRYNYDREQYRVLLFESTDEEIRKGKPMKFAGLTLGVQAPPAMASKVLTELKESLKHLVADKAYGYPGLKCLMSFEDPAEVKSTLLKDLRDLLDNRDDLVKALDRLGKTVDRLEETASKLGGVTNQLVQQELLAATAKRKEYPYPRLVILVPDGEADGTNERIQRVGWDRWRKAWESLSLPDVGLHHKFRLRFLCEHSLEEVRCGPEGLGYPVERLKDWVKQCVPLMKVRFGMDLHDSLRGTLSPNRAFVGYLFPFVVNASRISRCWCSPRFPQASLWILRVAVGTVSNVDLPLNQVLDAALEATGAAVLDGIGTEVPNSVDNDPAPVFGEGATVEQRQEFKDLQGTAYRFLCDFMQNAEPPTHRRLSGCLPCFCSSTPPTDLTPTVNWKDSMVQVRNRNGRWAWVLKKNEEAYRSAQPPIS